MPTLFFWSFCIWHYPCCCHCCLLGPRHHCSDLQHCHLYPHWKRRPCCLPQQWWSLSREPSSTVVLKSWGSSGNETNFQVTWKVALPLRCFSFGCPQTVGIVEVQAQWRSCWGRFQCPDEAVAVNQLVACCSLCSLRMRREVSSKQQLPVAKRHERRSAPKLGWMD